MTAAGESTGSLGRYRLVRHLATGGMAEVWIARVTGVVDGFERHVVVKCIRGDGAERPELVEMFLEEARLAASLHHHNIVQVHDIGVDRGRHFFAMEYVHGEDLRRLLAHAASNGVAIPIDHAVGVVIAAADGLHHAHEHARGIVHRDVSPANILVGYDGNVKVVDFGIAKATQRGGTCETRSGLMKGKVAYMSPEQCVGHAVDRRSDVFCLGIVLYELLAARRLFKGANDFLTMSAITSGVIPRLSEHRPDVPPELEAIVARALAHAPVDRYQTAADLRLDLERLAARLGLRTTASSLADYMRASFGARPVPWLAEDDEPEIEVVLDAASAAVRAPRASTDFDGELAGVVAAPVPAFAGAVPEAARPSSPIMRARRKAITNAPLPVDTSGAETHRILIPPAAAMPPAMPDAPAMSDAAPSSLRVIPRASTPLPLPPRASTPFPPPRASTPVSFPPAGMSIGGVPVVVTTPPSQPVMIGGIAVAAPPRARTLRERIELPPEPEPLPPPPAVVRHARLGSTQPEAITASTIEQAVEALVMQPDPEAAPIVMAAGSAAGRAPQHLIAEYTTPIVALAPAARLRWLAGAGAIGVLTIAAFAFAATRSAAPLPPPPPATTPVAIDAIEAPRPAVTAPRREVVLELGHERAGARAAVAVPPTPLTPPRRAVRAPAPPPRGAWNPDELFPRD